MASYQTSAPARNYLLSYWLEEKFDIESMGGGNVKDITMNRPKWPALSTMPFHVDPVKCQRTIKRMITGIIELCDVQQIFRMRLKEQGMMYMQQVDGYNVEDDDVDWVLKTNERVIKHVLANTNPKQKKPQKTGHMIPRIRSGSGAVIAVLYGMVAGKDAQKNGLIKGQRKAAQFFGCLEFAVVSKL